MQFTSYLKLKKPDPDDLYDQEIFEYNQNIINQKKQEIESQPSNGAKIIPVEALTTIKNMRVFNVRIGETEVTEIAGSKIYIPDYPESETITLYPNQVYTIYFLNDKCYIYWT